MRKKKDVLAILRRRATRKILEYLDEHGELGHKDLMEFATVYALNRILKELMDLDLIKCYIVKTDTKKEWYEITERGKNVLQCLRELERILRDT